MLHASVIDIDDVQLVGFGDFGGSAAIENLQRALLSLSQTGLTAANPGPVTGEVNTATISALTAVIGQLASMSATQRAAVQVAMQLALVNSNFMAAARSAVESQAATLQLAVLALVAKRTLSAPLPKAPMGALMTAVQPFQPSTASAAPSAATLPVGSFQARTAVGHYRVAVPKNAAVGLGASRGLGESLVELPPRAGASSGAILITESELDAKLKKPFYKRPLYWAALGGGLAVAGGAYWMLRR